MATSTTFTPSSGAATLRPLFIPLHDEIPSSPQEPSGELRTPITSLRRLRALMLTAIDRQVYRSTLNPSHGTVSRARDPSDTLIHGA